MVKVRLHGETEDLNEFTEFLSKLSPWVRILSISRNYKDRGASVYNRVYMDVELHQIEEVNAVIETALVTGGKQ